MGDHRAGTGGKRVARPTGQRAARRAEGPETTPRPEHYVGRRIAQKPTRTPARSQVAPRFAPRIEPAATEAPTLTLPVTPEPVSPVLHPVEPLALRPILPEPAPVTPTSPATPARVGVRQGPRRATPPPRPLGKRVASRRPLFRHLPSAPVLMGVAALAISVGGALQAVNPGLTSARGADHLVPASALSGSSAVGSASLLGGRSTVLSRDSNRQTLAAASGGSLLAQADAQVKERNAALSQLAAKAEKQAAKVKLNQWVLPVAAGTYQLTARFGDYSPLWVHFHTGLDFAAPTGTPIMAVAGGTITSTAYSGAYGNRTVETLPDGTELWYCHQNQFGTSPGATVRPGQVIGYVGSTGNVTGPHLHLEVHPGGGDPVDPFTALEVHGLHP